MVALGGDKKSEELLLAAGSLLLPVAFADGSGAVVVGCGGGGSGCDRWRWRRLWWWSRRRWHCSEVIADRGDEGVRYVGQRLARLRLDAHGYLDTQC